MYVKSCEYMIPFFVVHKQIYEYLSECEKNYNFDSNVYVLKVTLETIHETFYCIYQYIKLIINIFQSYFLFEFIIVFISHYFQVTFNIATSFHISYRQLLQ
jgi:hypothetical protein